MHGDQRGFKGAEEGNKLLIIRDIKFERTEDHNFTITTHSSQEVEFFHSLICGLNHQISKPKWEKHQYVILEMFSIGSQ